MKNNVPPKNISYQIEKLGDFNFVALRFPSDPKYNSIDCLAGETVYRAFEYATKKHMPVIAWINSSGIRVTDGPKALFQMVKMSLAVKKHNDEGLLFITILTDFALGGISASIVPLSDIIIADKEAVLGFTGKRIIVDTFNTCLPDDFQTAEYALRHGMIDIVVAREEITSVIQKILKIHMR